jgi:hypothetical protein
MSSEVGDTNFGRRPVEGLLRIVQLLAFDFDEKHIRIAGHSGLLFQQLNGHRVENGFQFFPPLITTLAIIKT